MRVDVEPRRLSAVPGQPSMIRVTVSNTGTVISGHRIRVLGLDPAWATLDQEDLSLFPDTSGVAVLTVRLPAGLPAGLRTLGIEVTELTPPRRSMVVDVELTVPAEPGLTLALDPVSVSGGRAPVVAVVLENTGNSVLDVHLEGVDEEGAITFAFTPPEPSLAQGDQLIGKATLKAHRPWFGTPKVRPFTVHAGPPRAPVIAFGAWVQKARFSRGMMALVGLLVAATVFAVVLTASLSQVVGNSNADRDLALQVAEASQNAAAGGSGGVSGASAASVTGTVTLLTSGAPVPGVTVQLFTAGNTTTPIVSTATGAPGTYTLTGLAPGSYKLEFEGAGFSQLWYPNSLTPANAGTVKLNKGATTKGVSIRLGGLPASVSGQVVGADPTGALLTLEVPPPGGPGAASTAAGGVAGAAPTGTVVTTRTLGSSGDFALGNIPSPALYEIVVTKSGYSPAVQDVNLTGGEQRHSVTITLHQGDGSITGTISGAGGPLGGATVSASDGSTTISTISVSTAGSVGTFVLNNLPTPAAFTLVVSANGYATQTLAQSLAPDQQLTGVAVSLTPGLGSISGTVRTAPGAAAGGATPTPSPTGGVTVTATDGKTTESTVSLSVGAVGTYLLTNLPVPGTYTVTFSRNDLASQTRALSLAATGPTNLTGVDANLVAKTAALYGTVTQTGGQGLGEVAVLLSSGTTSYKVTSSTVPKPGGYEIDGVTPGTYTVSFTRTGGAPTSSIVTLTAGQRLEDNPVLNAAASIYGHVVQAGNTSQVVAGVAVNLYLATQYPTIVTTSVVTDGQGNFTFANVQAPENYIVAFAYPQGGSNQETASIATTLGTASPVCGSQTTGLAPTKPPPSTTTPPATTGPTTTRPTTTTTSTSTTTTSTTTTTTIRPTTTTTTASTTTSSTTASTTTTTTTTTSLPNTSAGAVGTATATAVPPSVTSTATTTEATVAVALALPKQTQRANPTTCDPNTDPIQVSTS